MHLAVAVEFYEKTNQVIEGVYEGPGGNFIAGVNVATFDGKLDAQGSLILCLESFISKYRNGQKVCLAGVLLDPTSLEAAGVHSDIGGAMFHIQDIAKQFRAEWGVANPVPVYDGSDSDDQEQGQAGTDIKYRAPGFVPPSQCGTCDDPTSHSKRQRHL